MLAPSIGRRAVLSALAVVALTPERAPSLLKATPDAIKLRDARDKAASLVRDVSSLPADDLAMYVPQVAALYLKPGALALENLAPTIGSTTSSSSLLQDIGALTRAGRDGAREEAAGAAKRTLAALDEALRLATAVYAFPGPGAAGEGSSFTKAYFGPFTCEGVGLRRKPDSNQCEERDDKSAAAGAPN